MTFERDFVSAALNPQLPDKGCAPALDALVDKI
jgi:hypothetical protein